MHFNTPHLFDPVKRFWEDIHNLNRNEIVDFINLAKIKDGFQILDHGSGYGDITHEICRLNKAKNLTIYLQDISTYQLNRAKNFLKEEGKIYSINYFIGLLKDMNLDTDFFDIAFSKLVFQEMQLNNQLDELLELKRVVKKDGCILIWLIWLTGDFTNVFRDIIRKKDKIANLTTLVKNRYFSNDVEFINIMDQSGINNDFEFIDATPMIYETKNQLFGDFQNDPKKLNELNNYIRERISGLSVNLLLKINFMDQGDNISFIVPQKIVKIKNSKP